jgi:hypothetical protein
LCDKKLPPGVNRREAAKKLQILTMKKGNFMPKFVLLTALLLSLGLTACGPAPALDAKETELVLRTYQLPPEQTDAVRSTLKSLFSVKDDQPVRAKVDVLPDQQLVVYASEATQASVAAMLKTLKATVPATSNPQPQYKVSYWLVSAKASQNAAAELPANLTEVHQALQQINQQQGKLQFELLEQLQLASSEHAEAVLSGSVLRVQQRLGAERNGSTIAHVLLEKQLNLPAELRRKLPDGYRLDTSLTVQQPDQLLVIGANAGDSSQGEYLYCIIRISTQL